MHRLYCLKIFCRHFLPKALADRSPGPALPSLRPDRNRRWETAAPRHLPGFLALACLWLVPLPATAELWQVEGLAPPPSLRDAETVFQDARTRSKAAAPKVTQTLEALNEAENALHLMQVRIRDARAALETRRSGMAEEIARDAEVLAGARQKADARLGELDREADWMNAIVARVANDPAPSEADVGAARALLPRLRTILDRKADIQRRLGNVERGLANQAETRARELRSLAADIPDPAVLLPLQGQVFRLQAQVDYTKLQTRLARATETEAAITFLNELIAVPPEHLSAVDVRMHGETIYQGRWQATGEGLADTDQEKAALSKVLASEVERLKVLETARDRLRAVTRNSAQDIKYHNDIASNALQLIANEQLRTLVINTGLEMGGAAAGMIVSGGMTGLLTAASALKGSKPAIRELLTVPTDGEALAMLSQVVAADIAKHYNGKLAGSLEQANMVLPLAGGIRVNTGVGLSSDAGRLVAGDFVEIALVEGADKAAGTVLRRAGLVGAAKPKPFMNKGNLVDIVTTSLKAGVALRAEILNEARAWEYLVAHTRAQSLHSVYLQSKVAWLRSIRIVEAQREVVAALTARLENGLQARQLDASRKPADLVAGALLEIELEFSHQVALEPVIEAPSLEVIQIAPKGEGRRRWIATARLLEDRDKLTLSVGYRQTERPWSMLDSNPATPPRLASLTGPHWGGYEAGPDRNHFLLRSPADTSDCRQSETASGAGLVLAGGLNWKQLRDAAGEHGIFYPESVCEVWIRSVADLPCKNTTRTKFAELLQAEVRPGVFQPVTPQTLVADGQEVSWTVCRRYDAERRHCLDDRFADAPENLCLGPHGEVLSGPDGGPYSMFETRPEVYFDVNSPSCAGQADIRKCPMRSDEPATFMTELVFAETDPPDLGDIRLPDDFDIPDNLVLPEELTIPDFR